MRTIINIVAPANRRCDVPGAVEPRLPIRARDAFHPDWPARPGRVDKAPVPHIDADVRIRSLPRVVEQEVAGLDIGFPHRGAGLALLACEPGQEDAPRLPERMQHEAAAIESGLRRRAAALVTRAEL